jgi:HEAT repeat protein
MEGTMTSSYRIHLRRAVRQASHIPVLCAVPTGGAYGQAQQSQPEKLAYGTDKANVADAIAKVKSGDFAAIHVGLIVRAGAVEAVPSLRKQFVRVEDPLLKAKIASALVKMGEKDDSYWDYLMKLASRAIESEAPDFTSQEFEAWVKAHNLSPTATEEEMYLLPGAVGLLALTGDPRALPLLRRALMSPNHLTEIAAAMGLAELQDKQSISLIIEACRKAPPDTAAVIAESLVYFDDNAAQSAVDQYIPKDRAKIYRDARAHGKTSPLSAPLYDKLPNQ